MRVESDVRFIDDALNFDLLHLVADALAVRHSEVESLLRQQWIFGEVSLIKAQLFQRSKDLRLSLRVLRPFG